MDEHLACVYWIGGSPCCGKSTIADRLSAEFGFGIYRCDDAYERHRSALDPATQPVFARLSTADCDGLWMRPVQRQISEEWELYREEIPMILADLRADLRHETTRATGLSAVVAEGAALLPDLIAGLNPDPSRVIWIVPTDAFQREHYSRRAWRHEVLAACSDPTAAWENWMARDAGFARAVANDAGKWDYRVIWVDGARSLDQVHQDVLDHFGLPRSNHRERD